MKIKVLGCYGGQMPGRNNTAFLIDGGVLLDAGTIALNAGIEEQRKIRAVLLTHAHIDHTGALPFFSVNIVSNKGKGVDIWGSPYTLNALKKYLMNGITWPDFTMIKTLAEIKYLIIKR